MSSQTPAPFPVVLTAATVGGMIDRTDPTLFPLGRAREIRNRSLYLGTWKRRNGWEKFNKTACGVKRWCGIYSYRDTAKTLHIVAVGDNGQVYDDQSIPNPVTKYSQTTWDASYNAQFAAWGDHLFICIGSTTGESRNLRYDGIRRAVYAVGMDAPTPAPTLADGGGGGLCLAGTHGVRVTFYDANTGWESPASATGTLVLGVDNRIIDVTGIAVAPAATAAGRVIYRRLWWNIQGTDVYGRVDDTVVAELADNATTTYNINAALPSDTPLDNVIDVPVFKSVATMPDGTVAWANDVTNNRPNGVYFSRNATEPEALYSDTPDYLGGADDPVTGLFTVRDGTLVTKRRMLGWLPRDCKVCEGYVYGIGTASWATIQSNGNEFYMLSDRGPFAIDHTLQGDYRFIGGVNEESRKRFAIATTWGLVERSRLEYASSVHDSEHGLIAWFVQTCDDWPDAIGEHNNLAIIWDYGSATARFNDGLLHIHDIVIDHACMVPMEGIGPDEPWGAFPLGFIGQLWAGWHGDGCDGQSWATVTWVSDDGLTVEIDDTFVVDADLLGDGLKGTVAYVYGGAGMLGVEVYECDASHRIVVSDTLTSAVGRRLTFAMDIGLGVGSQIWFGGFNDPVDVQFGDLGHPGVEKTFHYGEMHTKG